MNRGIWKIWQLLRAKKIMLIVLGAVLCVLGTTILVQNKNEQAIANKNTSAVRTEEKTPESPSTNEGSVPQMTPEDAPITTPQAAPATQSTKQPTNTLASKAPATTVVTPVKPVPQPSFDIVVDTASIFKDVTGEYYVTFRIVRHNGLTGKITPSGVFVNPDGEWPNYIDSSRYFMIGEDHGAFFLNPEGTAPPKTFTVTVTAFSGIYHATTSFQYTLPD